MGNLSASPALTAMTIVVRGVVQGVGFRPAVWRLAHRHGLRGSVRNDGQGVQIYVIGPGEVLRRFLGDLHDHAPALARIDQVIAEPAPVQEATFGFRIEESVGGVVLTAIAPDTATCRECLREVLDPLARRFRYPFTTCTHCGPRLTIQESIPYDRTGTTMRGFRLCSACTAEYRDPADRRFHAQALACPACGPRVWLERADGTPHEDEAMAASDALSAATKILNDGEIVAIKGLGGVQLACDATQESTVSRLRALKGREQKPFALMARDLAVVQRWCEISEAEAALLQSPARPIVLLARRRGAAMAPSVAPNLRTLGVMLPNTPLHHLLLQTLDRPIVLTSGNRSEEPQWVDNESAKQHLSTMAAYFVLHNRDIAQRVDDSVTMVVSGAPRILRRSRGYAPVPIPMPPGFEKAPAVLAAGSHQKNTFCLVSGGRAVLSHHIGDLDDALTQADYRRALRHYQDLFGHVAQAVAIDRHPRYLSSAIGRAIAAERQVPLFDVQHHHAHLAACLAENGIPLDHPPVLGIALDGLGYGDDGTLWGGEFCRVDYSRCTRVATFKPVPLLGGTQAIMEPWRSTYAHLVAAKAWSQLESDYTNLELYRYLATKPRGILERMRTQGINSPPASSCGRLFDAVAAAVGICRNRASYEGQPAVEFEQLVEPTAFERDDQPGGYSFAIGSLNEASLPYLEPAPMWHAVLRDLAEGAPRATVAAGFHQGLATGVCLMVSALTGGQDQRQARAKIALSGGVFQNRLFFELVRRGLERMGFMVLSHAHVPPNDGGLALGQAAVAAAKAMAPESASCA